MLQLEATMTIERHSLCAHVFDDRWMSAFRTA
jgi:hypothetical protein